MLVHGCKGAHIQTVTYKVYSTHGWMQKPLTGVGFCFNPCESAGQDLACTQAEAEAEGEGWAAPIRKGSWARLGSGCSAHRARNSLICRSCWWL